MLHIKKKIGTRTSPVAQCLGSPASGAGGVDLILGWGTKMPHAAGHLSPCATTREKPIYLNERSYMSQLRFDAAKNK